MASVLFVCLGNICRSPMGEIVMNHLVQELNLQSIFSKIDSCGTAGYHVGENPDSRCIRVAKKILGPNISYSRSRKISKDDFKTFDYILCCDKSNYEDVMSLYKMYDKNVSTSNSSSTSTSSSGIQRPVIKLLGSYDPDGELEVRDPYYDSDDSGFERNYHHINRSLRAFLENFTLEDE